MIIFSTFKRVEMCIYYDGQAVYTCDIFCESNISHALYTSVIFF